MTKNINQSIASNFIWSVASEAVSKGTFFFVNVYLARTLGVENFGVFTLAQSITSSLWLAVDMGTNVYGMREIARHREAPERIVNPLLTLRMTTGLAVFLIYSLSLFLFNMPTSRFAVFAGCGLFLVTYSCYADWVLKGLGRFNMTAYGSVISSGSFFLGTVLLITDGSGLTTASFVWSFSFLMGSLSLIYFLNKRLGIRFRPDFHTGTWLFHLKESKYFMFSGILMVLYQNLPIYLLGLFFSSHEVGLFSAPFRLIMTISTAGFLLTTSFYPVLSELWLKDRPMIHGAHRLFMAVMLAIGLPIAVMGTFFSDSIIGLLFGSQYKESTAVFQVLIWMIPMIFYRNTYGTVLFAAGLQRRHNLASIIGVVAMAILGLIVMPRTTIIGCAIVIIISELLMLSGMFLLCYPILKSAQYVSWREK